MRRFKLNIDPDYGTAMLPRDGGTWVKAAEAQAEIDRLKNALEHQRHETGKRQSHIDGLRDGNARLERELAEEKQNAIDCQRTTEEMAAMLAVEKALADRAVRLFIKTSDHPEYMDQDGLELIEDHRKARGL